MGARRTGRSWVEQLALGGPGSHAAFVHLGSLTSDDADLVEDLRAALGHSNERVRMIVLCGLGQIGSAGEAAIPQMLAALESDPVQAVRQAAVHGLRKIGRCGDAVVPRLIAKLRQSDESESVRADAAHALLSFPAQGALSGPVLVAALRDPIERISYNAAISLKLLGGAVREQEPAIRAFIAENPEHDAADQLRALIRILEE